MRAERDARRWTQEFLAGLAGCSQATVSRIERGSRNIPDEFRVSIAAALHLDPYVLFPYDAPSSEVAS